MELKMMKMAELEQALEDTDHEHWHYIELSEERHEAQAEDQALCCDNGGYVSEIAACDEKAERALERMSELMGERMRRLGLSNHDHLAEAAMRGDLPV